MQAYTYSIRQRSTGMLYYGVRKSPVDDIGVLYFSSSRLVKRLISENGIDDFQFQLRRKFDSYEAARLHEHKMLRRMDVVHNSLFLNQAISTPRICAKDSVAESQRRQAIGNYQRKLWDDETYRSSHWFANISQEERSSRGRIGAAVRAAKYASGVIPKKVRGPKTYSDVIITRNGLTKTVKRNQVPAYRKCGWEKI